MPYCESFKVNENDVKTNQRGKYKEVGEHIKMRTWSNMKEKNHEAYVLNGNGNRKVLQDFKNQEFLPIKVKKL